MYFSGLTLYVSYSLIDALEFQTQSVKKKVLNYGLKGKLNALVYSIVICGFLYIDFYASNSTHPRIAFS